MGLRNEAISVGREIWASARPHVVKIGKNFVVCVSYWVAMYTFHFLVRLLPVTGTAGQWAVEVVSFGELAAIALFIYYSLIDALREGKAICLAY